MVNLVIGASGFVGNYVLLQLKKQKTEVIGTFYSRPKPNLLKFDMTSQAEIKSLFSQIKPTNVYMPAFISGVDACELNEEFNSINELGIRNVVNYCKKYDSKIIFYSTDYVFDGICGPYIETDKPNPINKYGKTKLKCEKIVEELEDYLIIRTTVVYGFDLTSKNFLITLLEDLKNNTEKKIPFDQIGTPTYVGDLAEISIKLAERNKIGIYNVVGPDLCSRYVFSLKIARIFDLNQNLIKPISTIELKQVAKRPLKAGLIIDKIITEIDAKPSGIDETLKMIKEKFIN